MSWLRRNDEKTLANPNYVRRAPIVTASKSSTPTSSASRRMSLGCWTHNTGYSFSAHGMRSRTPAVTPRGFDGSIGVYGTSSPSGYSFQPEVAPRPQCRRRQGLNFGQSDLSLQNDKDFLATRVSHQFDLRWSEIDGSNRVLVLAGRRPPGLPGPVSGGCDMLWLEVIASVPHQVGYWTSPGQWCRPWASAGLSTSADGTVFGSGVAIVVLKPLQAAVDAGDRIHAVIRGSAINNDGSMKMGYAAPNPVAQAESSPRHMRCRASIRRP